jgi:hypothetical protein
MTKIVYLSVHRRLPIKADSEFQLFAVYHAYTLQELEEKIREARQDRRFWLETGFIGVHDEFPLS